MNNHTVDLNIFSTNEKEKPTEKTLVPTTTPITSTFDIIHYQEEYITHGRNDSNATNSTDNSSKPMVTNEKKLNQAFLTPKTHWSAWAVAISVMILNTACTMMWMTLTSTPFVSTQWLQADLTKINWLSNVAAISNATFSLVAAYTYERFGVKKSIVAAGCINFVGCWIRCIAIFVSPEKRYAIVLVGQTIASIGGPFVYNVAPKLVSVWFAPKHRVIANTLITLSVGMLFSPLLLPALVREPDQIPKVLIIVAAVSTACAIPIMFTPSKPKVAPSMSASTNRMTVWQGTKELMKNFQFWIVCIPTAVNSGMCFQMGVILTQSIAPLGYTEQQGGLAAFMIMLGGFIGGSMVGYWIGKTQQHLMIIKLFSPIMCGTYIMAIFEIVPNAYGVIVCLCFMIGFFSMGLFPIQLEYAVEISYPVPESVSSNIIWAASTVCLMVFTVISDSLRAGPDAVPPNNMANAMVASAIIVCVGTIPTIWLKGDMKRMAVDQEAALQ